MKSGNLLNSNSMIRYPRAKRWMKAKATKAKLDITYDLARIETITAHRDFDEYLGMKEEFRDISPFTDTLLYKDWLIDEIDKSNAGVYRNRFQLSQDIRYFRNYFKETEEQESRNSKGEIIELKAYGKSNKMNREIIVFEGRFMNGKLASYKDKTDGATGYARLTSGKDHDIVRENFPQYLETLIQNDCADLFSDDAMKIIVSNPEAIMLLIEHGMSNLIPSDAPDRLITKMQHLKILAEKNLLHLLSPGKIESIVYHGISLYKELSQKILEDIESGKYITLFPIVGAPYSKLGEFKLPTYDHNNNATPLGSFFKLQDIVDLVEKRVQNDYLFSERYHDKSWTPDLKAKIRGHTNDSSRDMILKRMKMAIESSKRRQAESARQEILVKESEIQVTGSSSRTPGKGWKWMTLLGVIALAFMLYWNNRPKIDSISDRPEVSITDSSLELHLQLDTLPDGTTIFISPGSYVVSAQAGKGVALYMDARQRKKHKNTATPLSEVQIEKVENGMGYFRTYTNGNGRKSKPGWIEMRHLEPQ
jgi:hypothetical protein